MPATSLASAAEYRARRERANDRAALALWREALAVAAQRALESTYAAMRSGWLYRQTLRGPVPDRILFQPDDPRPRRLDDADAMFRGRFRLGGKIIDARERSIFHMATGDAALAALHGFDWLRHLEAAGGEPARALALKLAQDWLARNGRYTRPAWQPEIAAARFLNLFAHGRFFLTNSDLLWRSKFFVSLRNQARVLARTISEAPDGVPRFEAAAALALAGLCLADQKNAAEGLARLSFEISRQILPDGGHVTRSPEALLQAFRALAMVDQALAAQQREAKSMLRAALDRMAPMVRFFRMGDDALAVFNGGGEADARLVAALLTHDDTGGRPFGHAPHSGYQRLSAGKTQIVMDVGRPPPAEFSTAAHAGCLAFEMSTGPQRMIVNCGAAVGGEDHWGTALRTTPAHSTLVLDDASSAYLLPEGSLRGFLGARLLPGPTHIDTHRGENEQGLVVEASHDGYVRDFGVLHQRRLALGPRGTKLTGADRLIPGAAHKSRRGRAEAIPFAIRFHVHPDVRLSLAQGGGSVILKLPTGEGWRFRAGGDGAVSIEESIYFGGGTLRRTEQLVVTGQVKDAPVECAWLLEQVTVA
jgi:uncharacterized heparinase superfamily protein